MGRIVPIPFPSDPAVTNAGVLGAAVRAARTGVGMTLADAAAFVGVAKQTLNDLELGKASVSLGLALKIANGLGVALFVAPATERETIRRRLMSPNR